MALNMDMEFGKKVALIMKESGNLEKLMVMECTYKIRINIQEVLETI
jgi:hypothetical protein